MKHFTYILLLGLILTTACNKNRNVQPEPESDYATVPYDTTAIDSFSDGAASVDVARQIKQSSVAYQDSVKNAIIEQEKLRLEQEKKKKEEEEKKKSEEKAKKEEEKKPTTEPTTTSE